MSLPTDKIRVREYWSRVFKRAFKAAYEDSDMKTVIRLFSVILVCGLIASFIIAIGGDPPIVLKDFVNDIGGAWRAFWAVFLLMIFTLIVLLYRVPAEMDKEKCDEIAEDKQIISRLKEATRPKLELSYDDNDLTCRQHWGKNLYSFRIIVKNNGNELLNNLRVTIEETRPKSYDYSAFDLQITHNASNFLNPSNKCHINVLETYPENAFLKFIAKEQALQQPCSIQNYEIRISASGDKSPVVEKWFRFTVMPDSERAYEFEEIK